MTATLDGTSWIPVSTRARLDPGTINLEASDCTHLLRVGTRFKGLGTYEVASGDVVANLRCDYGPFCGSWLAGADKDRFSGIATVNGSGSLTVTAYTPPTPGIDSSGAIEGTFSFTLIPDLGINPLGRPARGS